MLELIFLVQPVAVFFIFFLVFPFLSLVFFVPVFVLLGAFLGDGIGGASSVRVEFHSGGGTIAFIQKYAIYVMAFDTGHFASSCDSFSAGVTFVFILKTSRQAV
jgi:hypothetical protein